jgi:ATP-dependent helicase/nuclease subunit B
VYLSYMTFLGEIAARIQADKTIIPEKTVLVFPNRRAGLMFREEFRKQLKKPAIAPSVFSIEDFIATGYQGIIKDRNELLFYLYELSESLKEAGEEPEDFKQFLNWAPVFLSDINEIDKHLIAPEKIFGNLKDVKEIETWSLSAGELTPFQEAFVKFYERLGRLYQALRSKFEKSNYAWEGLAFRLAAEKTESFREWASWDCFLFAGFNALSPAEATLIKKLKTFGRVEIFWDYDTYYYADKDQEAGHFLRKQIPSFSIPGKETPFPSKNLLEGKPDIECIGLAGGVTQARYAGAWLEKKMTTVKKGETIAIVLADESLLLPLLNALPDQATGVNVTMGFPLKETPPASLAYALLKLLKSAGFEPGSGTPAFPLNDFLEFLSSPTLSQVLDQSEIIMKLKDDLKTKRIRMVSASDLKDIREPGLKTIFDRLFAFRENANGLRILESIFLNLFETARDKDKTEDAEYIFELLHLIRKVEDWENKFRVITNTDILLHFFRQLLGRERIPFYGEPVSDIQILGILETRALDFDHVLVLSANENLIPPSRKSSTLIPVDLRSVFGLHTFREHESLSAYYFYRLLQRSRSATLLYQTIKDVFGSGEKSRFIQQLSEELGQKNPAARITDHPSGPMPDQIPFSEIRVEKSAEMTREIQEKVKEGGFSPSSLSTYILCPLKFYFNWILKVGEEEDEEEILVAGADTLGNAVHKTLQELYEPYKGKSLTKDDIAGMERDYPAILLKAFVEEFGNNFNAGKNFLTYKLAETGLARYFKLEKTRLKPGKESWRVFDLEKKFIYRTNGDFGEYMIKGTLDRIDRFDDHFLIIDYKTGKVEAKDLKLPPPENLFTSGKHGKVFQMLTYLFLFRSDQGNTVNTEAGIFSIQRIEQGLIPLSFDGKPRIPDDYQLSFTEKLQGLCNEVMNPEIPFTQTTDKKNCRYCPYKEICHR